MKKIDFIYCLFLITLFTQDLIHSQVNVDNIFCLGNGLLAAYET